MTDDPDRRNLLRTGLAALFVSGLTAAGALIAKALVDQQKLDRCIAQRRRDCLDLQIPQKPSP